jgi:hypothetical protein
MMAAIARLRDACTPGAFLHNRVRARKTSFMHGFSFTQPLAQHIELTLILFDISKSQHKTNLFQKKAPHGKQLFLAGTMHVHATTWPLRAPTLTFL